MTAPVSRRRFLEGAGAAGMVTAVAACAPAASPPAPAAPQTSPANPAPARAAWEVEWERLTAAAKQEGRLAVASLSGPGYQKGMEAFMTAFPGVKVELQQVASASILIPKVPYTMDSALVPRFHVDTNQVKDGEITSVRDLLGPKWKGRIILPDVRSGGNYPMMTAIRQNLGDDVVKRLIVDQQPFFTRDDRQLAEGVARGQYPITLGNIDNYLQGFREQGIAKSVKALHLSDAGVIITIGCLFLMNRAPDPNAAKLFINWVLTKDAQNAWCQANAWNSRRLDVPPANEDAKPRPGVKYFEGSSEKANQVQVDTRTWLESLRP